MLGMNQLQMQKDAGSFSPNSFLISFLLHSNQHASQAVAPKLVSIKKLGSEFHGKICRDCMNLEPVFLKSKLKVTVRGLLAK
jgi:hypothetical protein